MKRNLKKQLKSAFDSPLPTKKQDFLNNFAYPKASRLDFIWAQASYIRKRVWAVSALIFIAALCILHFYKPQNLTSQQTDSAMIWIVSAILPFIALIAVTEIAKSTAYNMAELEMSCKHNFGEVTLIRMGILGAFQFVMLIAILLLFVGKTDFGFFRLCLYLTAPFLLNCYGTLFVLNRLRNRETLYICTAVTGFVSVMSIVFIPRIKDVFSEQHVQFWIMPFSILLILSVLEIIKLIKRTEDLQWNSVLTA